MRGGKFALLVAILTLNLSAHPNLQEYVGTYTYESAQPIEIVAGDELFAVLDEAKYRLRPSGVDEFTNAVGQKIYLLPQYDLVAVFTAGDYNSVEGAPPNRIMAKIILPVLIAAQTHRASTPAVK